jgi:flagellar hook protein FlgE
MSFLTSLSGLKAAQTELSVVSNNIANGNSTGFKKSRAAFGDLFAASPTQATSKIAGQGVQLQGITQQFTQGTLQTTDRTLDLAVAGEGFFTVKSPDATASVTYTRNGAFSVNNDREVVDSTGNIVQLLPVDAQGQITSNDPADMVNLVLPESDPADPNAVLANINVDTNGTIIATYSNGNQEAMGSLAMASFVAVEGLRPVGDAHWQATGQSGLAELTQAGSGPMGSVRSGSLETANIDITEELVSLIAAQRNFQANAQAIETANNMTQTIVNLQV